MALKESAWLVTQSCRSDWWGCTAEIAEVPPIAAGMRQKFGRCGLSAAMQRTAGLRCRADTRTCLRKSGQFRAATDAAL